MQSQLSVVHQLTGDYRSGFMAICDATIALLIYAVKWAFISKSVSFNEAIRAKQRHPSSSVFS